MVLCPLRIEFFRILLGQVSASELTAQFADLLTVLLKLITSRIDILHRGMLSSQKPPLVQHGSAVDRNCLSGYKGTAIG